MCKIRFAFKEDYIGAITIRHRIEEITGTSTFMEVDFNTPKIIDVFKEAYYNWPDIIEATVGTRDIEKVIIEEESNCLVDHEDNSNKWTITPNTGVNAFRLKISLVTGKFHVGGHHGGGHHGGGDTECQEGNGGVTVTIGEP